MGDDSSTKCDVCGNPFIDTTGKTPEEMKMAAAEPDEESIKATFVQAVEASGHAAQTERERAAQASAQKEPERAAQERPVQTSAQENPAQASAQNEQHKAAQRAPQGARPAANRPARRMRSGPQIYGQEGSGADAQGYDRQGAIRRNVQHTPQQNRPAQRGESQSWNVSGQNGAQPQMNMQGQANARRQAGPSGQMNQPNRPLYQGAQAGQNPYNQPPRQAMPSQGAGARTGAPTGSFQAHRMQEVSRSMLKSPIFLLIAILNTVCFVGTIAAIFLRQMNYSQVIRLIKGFDLPAQISGYVSSVTSVLSMLDSGALLANLAMHIPDLLFVIALWMIFLAAVKSKDRMSGIGFGFAKATVLINMVVACAVSAAALIITVAVVIASWVSGTTLVVIGAAAALVIAITAVMMVIMYYFCHLATIKTCRLNSVEGESYGKVSRYVAVIHIVLGLMSIVDLLSGIVNSELSNIIGAIGKIGWMFLLAIWIFMYRDKMEEIGE